MITILKNNGNGDKIVAKSQNLLGILSYARTRKTFVTFVAAVRLANGGGRLCVTWNDGAFCGTNFESYDVLQSWIANRRSWKDAELFV